MFSNEQSDCVFQYTSVILYLLLSFNSHEISFQAIVDLRFFGTYQTKHLWKSDKGTSDLCWPLKCSVQAHFYIFKLYDRNLVTFLQRFSNNSQECVWSYNASIQMVQKVTRRKFISWNCHMIHSNSVPLWCSSSAITPLFNSELTTVLSLPTVRKSDV